MIRATKVLLGQLFIEDHNLQVEIKDRLFPGIIFSLSLHLTAFLLLSAVSSKIHIPSLAKKGTSLLISLTEKKSLQSSSVEKDQGKTNHSLVSAKTAASVGANDKNALYIQGPMPVYPRPAKKRGIEGDVVLKIHIDDKGIPYLIEIADSSGHSILDQAAINGVKKWRFDPASKEGIKIASSIEKRFSFRLN